MLAVANKMTKHDKYKNWSIFRRNFAHQKHQVLIPELQGGQPSCDARIIQPCTISPS